MLVATKILEDFICVLSHIAHIIWEKTNDYQKVDRTFKRKQYVLG